MNDTNRIISSFTYHTFLLILCISDSIQQMIGFGRCPSFNGKIKDFKVAQYLGLWFEQYRNFITPEIGTSCTQVDLTNSEEGSLLYQITYFNTWYFHSSSSPTDEVWNNEYDTVTGTARFEAPDSEGKFSLDFPGRGNSSVKFSILDTDYQSYSVVWSCENKKGNYNLRNIWIFTREQHPLYETLQKALVALRKLNFPTKLLMKSDQSDCIRPDVEYEIETDSDAEYIDDIDLKKNVE